MTITLLSHDIALLAHWQPLSEALPRITMDPAPLLDSLPAQSLVLCDLDCARLPALSDPRWLAWNASLRIIAASSAPRPDENVAALAAGFRGYAHAFAPVADWRQIVATVRAGGIWIGPDVMARLLGTLHFAVKDVGGAWREKLSPREADVAERAAQGLANKQIARELNITERTVKAHLGAAFAKLGVHDRLQLALLIKGVG
ncbi:response regulator transcription factor [Chitinolyticbacter albus]|uniref:response regulator transcription factor n=1 Tax=Chitinolyticbacter albus TaxID=2961951 RepID=UPI00210CAA5E|nr:response regulator transcription factor [Chitinolyticbacter albus]